MAAWHVANRLSYQGRPCHESSRVGEWASGGGIGNVALRMAGFEDDSLKAVTLLPECFRSIFSFRYFNPLQSEVISYTYQNDGNMVVSAPTGSGKTVVFELAILRSLSKFISEHGILCLPSGRAKVVYVAPQKALVQERLRGWTSSFGRLGLVCQEATGDSGNWTPHLLQALSLCVLGRQTCSSFCHT